MRKIFRKAPKLIICSIQYVRYKLQYRSQLNMCFLNSIQGKFDLRLKKGANCRIGKFLMMVGPLYLKCEENAKLSIGNRCFFNHNSSITCLDRITIGDGCMFANNLVIVDHDHRLGTQGLMDGFLLAPITIGDRVWCGANVTILRGVTIGEGAVVAAGAVVTTDIPPYEVWGGVPAHCIKRLKE